MVKLRGHCKIFMDRHSAPKKGSLFPRQPVTRDSPECSAALSPCPALSIAGSLRHSSACSWLQRQSVETDTPLTVSVVCLVWENETLSCHEKTPDIT